MSSPTLARRLGVTGNKGIKAPVRTASSANITLSGEQSVGGAALVTGDRCLVWMQTDPTQNGIYDVSTGSWTRAIDANGTQDLTAGTIGIVTEGSYADEFWILTTTGDIVPGTTAMTFLVGVPSLAILAASSGASLSGYIEAGANAMAVTAQSRAIDAAAADGLGQVFLPRGALTLGDLSIPAGVILRGQGQRGTAVTYSGSGTFALLGGTAGAVYYGCGISDLAIVLTTNTAEAVRMKGTVGAEVARLYIEGYINAGRTNNGVVVDGGNASSFFNKIDSVICNHVQNSYQMVTTGSQPCTDSYFSNCTAGGDASGGAGVGAASVGFFVAVNQGQGTVFNGGNIEDLGTGILMDGSGRVTFVGTRFESGSNTVDIQLNVNTRPCSFIGLMGIQASKVIDNSGTGFSGNTFLGCIDETAGGCYPNRLSGSTTAAAQKSTDIALRSFGYPASTEDLYQALNGSGVEQVSIGYQGNITTVGNIEVAGNAILLKTTNALANGANASTATMTNAPSAGNPTKWVPFNDAGTIRYFPSWT